MVVVAFGNALGFALAAQSGQAAGSAGLSAQADELRSAWRDNSYAQNTFSGTTADVKAYEDMTSNSNILIQFKGLDGKPIYQNDDQRTALINLLEQDPSMTPEKLAHAQDMARLSDSTYLMDVKNPELGLRESMPEHYRRVTNYEKIDALNGFTRSDFENKDTGFYADLFENTRTGNYALAFRGSDDIRDWEYGNRQAFDPNAPQYEQAINLARGLKLSLGDKLTDITGHSLSGGLGAATSIVTGVPAITFNAAGLNPDTITSRGYAWDTTRNESLVTNYRVRDELLTGLQEHGAFGSLPLALLTPVIGPSAIALNAFAASLPNAVGRQITIEAFNTQSQQMNWLQRNNIFSLVPLDLHGLDYVKRGMLINEIKRP